VAPENRPVDFDGQLTPEHLLVVELSPRVKTEDVAESKRHVEALLAERLGPA
jgi:hypothetical protein